MATDDVIETLTSPGGRTDVLAEGVDEQGPYVRFRHRTRHQGRMAGPHWHPALTERFTLVGGALRIVLDGQVMTPMSGETITMAPHRVHEFGHDGDGELVFDHEVRPPGQHRAMFELMHALDATGRLTRAGLPRDPLASDPVLWRVAELVQTPVAGLGALAHHGGLRVGPPGPDPAGSQRASVVPGGLNQQPTGVAIAGLGDRALGAPAAGGVLGGHQPEVGADSGAGEPAPVGHLDTQPGALLRSVSLGAR